MADAAGQVVDDEVKAPGPWPESIPFMRGLVKYKPAQWTQRIAITDNRDTIGKVHRTQIEDQHLWGQPGGMHGIKGWRSDLYKYIPEGGQIWIGNIDVWNGDNFQKNRGHKRFYPNGTIFIDCLSNAKSGKVFEKRVREKENGRWNSYVSFKDVSQRPPGYHGLRGMKCASCHSQAGSGGYAQGLIPGGDTVLSDPIIGLE